MIHIITIVVISIEVVVILIIVAMFDFSKGCVGTIGWWRCNRHGIPFTVTIHLCDRGIHDDDDDVVQYVCVCMNGSSRMYMVVYAQHTRNYTNECDGKVIGRSRRSSTGRSGASASTGTMIDNGS